MVQRKQKISTKYGVDAVAMESNGRVVPFFRASGIAWFQSISGQRAPHSKCLGPQIRTYGLLRGAFVLLKSCAYCALCGASAGCL